MRNGSTRFHTKLSNLLKCFGLAQRFLPAKLERAVGRSRTLRPLRDRILRPNGKERLEREVIKWESFSFEMLAPPRVILRARHCIENRICRLIISECKPDSVVLDVGANYGFISMAAAQVARVVSIECVTEIYDALCQSIQASGLDCEVICAFAGDSSGTLRIDSLDIHFDVIKIDVDGPDYQVLCGAEKTIEKCHPLIIIETETRAEDIYQFLARHYPIVADMAGKAVSYPLPVTMVASMTSFRVPERGSLVVSYP